MEKPRPVERTDKVSLRRRGQLHHADRQERRGCACAAAIGGATDDGTKLVVGLQSGDKESATTWREFFRDLKSRGLDGSLVKLGIMDGLSGLEKVFKEMELGWRIMKVERCIPICPLPNLHKIVDTTGLKGK